MLISPIKSVVRFAGSPESKTLIQTLSTLSNDETARSNEQRQVGVRKYLESRLPKILDILESATGYAGDGVIAASAVLNAYIKLIK